MKANEVISRNPCVVEVDAETLRVGKQINTTDGWQTIRGLVIFRECDQVSVFTDERDPDDVEEAWRFRFGDRVQTRLTPTAEEEYQQRRLARFEASRHRRLAMAAAECPAWCVEHYDCADDDVKRNHTSEPVTVIGADATTDAPVEFEFWIERRDSRYTGGAETVGVLHTRIVKEDIELTPDAMLLLSARLSSLAHRAQLAGGAKR
uniref:DUF6907 domain-containing protein n=1 Tax=Paractinoplanes polyasparticus TaxID=2856853 RepID=UPI001C85DD2E|nr:hypothetical protein [Actinoplanes polyasparticus]